MTLSGLSLRPLAGFVPTLIMLGACNKTPATAVVVHVVASDEVRTQVNTALNANMQVRVRLSVRSSSSNGTNLTDWRQDERVLPGAGTTLLDATLTPTGNDASRLYEVVGAVLVGERVLGEVRARSGYARGRVLLLRLLVLHDCSLTGSAPTCSENETCATGSGCTAATRPAESLPDFMPSVLDAGLDRGIDMGLDAARDVDLDTTVDATSTSDAASADVAEENLTCPSGYHRCGAQCALNTSVDSCGSRCEPCTAPRGGSVRCEAGSCVPVCAQPAELCDNACVAKATDPLNCGMCGRVCGAPQICVSGACVAPPACVIPADCPAATYCTSTGQCAYGCDEPRDCVGAIGQCIRITNTCVAGCDDDADCPGRMCGAEQQCVCPPMSPIWCSAVQACRAESITACGPQCENCPGTANGVATCTSGQCGFTCTAPAERRGDVCVVPWQTAPAQLLPHQSWFRQFGAALAFGSDTGDVTLFVGDPEDEQTGGRVYRFFDTGSGWSTVPFTAPTLLAAGGPFVRFGALLSASGPYLLVGDPGADQAPGRLFVANLAFNWSTLQTGVGVGRHAANFQMGRIVATTSTGVSTWSDPGAPMVTTLSNDCSHIAISTQQRAATSCAGTVQAYQFQGSVSVAAIPRPNGATTTFGDALAASSSRYFVGDPNGAIVYVFSSTFAYALERTLTASSSCSGFGKFVAANDNRLLVLCDTGVRIFGPSLQPDGFVAFPESVSNTSGVSLALAPGGNRFALGFPEGGTNGGGAVFVYTR